MSRRSTVRVFCAWCGDQMIEPSKDDYYQEWHHVNRIVDPDERFDWITKAGIWRRFNRRKFARVTR